MCKPPPRNMLLARLNSGHPILGYVPFFSITWAEASYANFNPWVFCWISIIFCPKLCIHSVFYVYVWGKRKLIENGLAKHFSQNTRTSQPPCSSSYPMCPCCCRLQGTDICRHSSLIALLHIYSSLAEGIIGLDFQIPKAWVWPFNARLIIRFVHVS